MFSTIGYYICVPFAALLRLFYNLTGSYGVAIIFFTLVIKLILLPFQMKSKKSMIRMNRMSGKIQEIQKKYANNQIKMNEELQKFYQEENVNPMSGCLWSFLPFPVLIALYSIVREPITHFMMLSNDVLQELVKTVTAAGADMSAIVQMRDGAAVLKNGVTQLMPYGEINLVKTITSQFPEAVATVENWLHLDYDFLGIDLAATPSSVFGMMKNGVSWALIGLILIPVLSGVLSFVLSKVSMAQNKVEGSAAAANHMTMWMMPLMSIYIGFIMPAALGVYWIAQSAFSIVQEMILGKFYTKKLEAEETARFEAREADRKRRMEQAKALQEEYRQKSTQKQTLKEKRRAAQEAKAAKAKKAGFSTTEAGRVGERPYARGRSYRADRYDAEN